MKASACRLVILISGRGSNMQAIVRAAQALPGVDVLAVIANRADAAGLRWAREQGLETRAVPHGQYPDREQFDAALGDVIAGYAPDYILLAGFMRVLSAGFVHRFARRVINIHPSLLPAFPGLHTHRQALQAGVQWHGCTIHFITPAVDHGPIIAQGVVPVRADDTEAMLAGRVLKLEHVMYAQVVQWLAEGRVHVSEQGHVSVDGASTRTFMLPSETAAAQEGYG